MPSLSEENCVIASLPHALGKAGMPGHPQHKKNSHSEKQRLSGFLVCTPNRFNNQLTYLSVSIRVFCLTLSYLPLTQVDSQGIAYLDEHYDQANYSVAARQCDLTLLQYANHWSVFAVEKEHATQYRKANESQHPSNMQPPIISPGCIGILEAVGSSPIHPTKKPLNYQGFFVFKQFLQTKPQYITRYLSSSHWLTRTR